jgi:RNA polymerase sigma-70 factor (ECF subfamily)
MTEHDQERTAKSFDDFYRAEFVRLTWFAVRMGAFRAEAEEIAQEAMTAAWRTWQSLAHPPAYVRMAAMRILYRAHAKAGRERIAVLRAAGPDLLPLDEPEVHRVVNLLRALPAAQREALALTMDGFTPKEIAEMTGREAATVRSHLRHARRNLARSIGSRREARDER